MCPMPSHTAASNTVNTTAPRRTRRAPRATPAPTIRRPDKAGVANRPRFTFRHKLVAVIWLSIVIVVAMTAFRDTIAQLGSWGYLGAFFINGISSATVVLPAPGGAIVLLMAPDYNPLLLGVSAGLGGAIGSFTAYLVGAHARHDLQQRRFYSLAHRLMHRFGSVILLLATLMPISPGDFAGILAGATGYPKRKFFVYVSIASIIKMTVMVYLAAASLEWLSAWLERWSRVVFG